MGSVRDGVGLGALVVAGCRRQTVTEGWFLERVSLCEKTELLVALLVGRYQMVGRLDQKSAVLVSAGRFLQLSINITCVFLSTDHHDLATFHFMYFEAAQGFYEKFKRHMSLCRHSV